MSDGDVCLVVQTVKSSSRCNAMQLSEQEALSVWLRSDQASAFNDPRNLRQLARWVEWWGVDFFGEKVAAWPLVRAEGSSEIEPPPFCYYLGPLFIRSLQEKKYHHYWAIYTEILRAFVAEFELAYSRFKFSMPIGVTDLRVFNWWNFEHPNGPKFIVRPRYTARLDLNDFPDEELLRQSFSRDRRRHIARWSRSGVKCSTSIDQARVFELYDEVFSRGGQYVDEVRRAALHRMLSTIESGAGEVLGFTPHGEVTVQAVIVLLHGPYETNNILHLSSGVWRSHGLSAWAVWQGLMRCRELGKRWFDFNGANSPQRAQDKHYFSARTELYFDVSFDTAVD